jgi:hypothetical protein
MVLVVVEELYTIVAWSDVINVSDNAASCCLDVKTLMDNRDISSENFFRLYEFYYVLLNVH